MSDALRLRDGALQSLDAIEWPVPAWFLKPLRLRILACEAHKSGSKIGSGRMSPWPLPTPVGLPASSTQMPFGSR